MFNLVIILLSILNDETKDSNNYKIAKYLMENLRDLEGYSLTDLAKACYVSNSSVSRFCRDIGLRDFNDLRNQIAKYSIESLNNKAKYNYEGKNDAIFTSYIHSVITNLNYFLEKNLEQELDQLVEDIYHYQKVAAFGYMQSANTAFSLQFDLQTNGKLIYSCYNTKNQAEYITQANENHLIIIFSESGTYFERIFSRIKPFKDHNKPKIYMITANQTIHDPLVDHYIRYNSRGDYASHPYPLQLISDMICIKYANLK